MTTEGKEKMKAEVLVDKVDGLILIIIFKTK